MKIGVHDISECHPLVMTAITCATIIIKHGIAAIMVAVLTIKDQTLYILARWLSLMFTTEKSNNYGNNDLNIKLILVELYYKIYLL